MWVEPNYDTILLYGVGSAGGNGSVGDGDGSGGVGAGVVRQAFEMLQNPGESLL